MFSFKEEFYVKVKIGSLWQSKDDWYLSPYGHPCLKDEIVLVTKARLYSLKELYPGYNTVRIDVSFLGKRNVTDIDIPVKNWFVFFKEIDNV